MVRVAEGKGEVSGGGVCMGGGVGEKRRRVTEGNGGGGEGKVKEREGGEWEGVVWENKGRVAEGNGVVGGQLREKGVVKEMGGGQGEESVG